MVCSHQRLSKMSYYRFGTPNYEFYIEPTGIRKYLRFLPYLSGGFLVFDLYAIDKNMKQTELVYEWRITRMYNKKYYLFEDMIFSGIFNAYAKGRPQTLYSHLAIAQVSASGQYRLQLKAADEMNWTTITDFQQLSRDETYMNLILAGIGFLGLIIGAVIGGIIGWKLNGR